ncbi:MAG: YfhO family protein [Zoogloeaceae bacterium]|jgi:hypothetical protein|nr:YfhO family protein [Zoogloeaceae bacterium]
MMRKPKRNDRFVQIARIHVSVVLCAVAVFLLLKQNIVSGMFFLLLFVLVATGNLFVLEVARVVFGLLSAFGIAFFFNPFLLRDFDLLWNMPRGTLLFFLYEIVFLSCFFACGRLILRMRDNAQNPSDTQGKE